MNSYRSLVRAIMVLVLLSGASLRAQQPLSSVDTIPPTVRLLDYHTGGALQDSSSFVGFNNDFPIMAEAVDDDSVLWVRYIVDSVETGPTVGTPPYAASLSIPKVNWMEENPIPVTLSALAMDRSGNIGRSEPVTVLAYTVVGSGVDLPGKERPAALSITTVRYREAAGTVRISFATQREMPVTATISDLSGRTLATVRGDREYEGSDCVLEVDARYLPPGGCVVQLQARDGKERAGGVFMMPRW